VALRDEKNRTRVAVQFICETVSELAELGLVPDWAISRWCKRELVYLDLELAGAHGCVKICLVVQ
jgi:hypothetical protein